MITLIKDKLTSLYTQDLGYPHCFKLRRYCNQEVTQ